MQPTRILAFGEILRGGRTDVVAQPPAQRPAVASDICFRNAWRESNRVEFIVGSAEVDAPVPRRVDWGVRRPSLVQAGGGTRLPTCQ